MNQEDLSLSLTAASFLELKAICRFGQARYQLPNTSNLLNQEHFGDVFMGWDLSGLHFHVVVKTKKIQSSFPDLSRGDSFEVMIDTRNVKSPITTKFCHHFFFLVDPVDDVIAGEKTRFRTEDAHELAGEDVFVVDTKRSSTGYQMRIFIPKSALFGFDPEGFKELGFNYRLNRFGGASQEFSASSKEFPIEQHPKLWSHLQLENSDV